MCDFVLGRDMHEIIEQQLPQPDVRRHKAKCALSTFSLGNTPPAISLQGILIM